MQLYIDNSTNSLVTSATILTQPTITLFKEDVSATEIRFVQNGSVVDIGTPTICLAIGKKDRLGDYSLIAITETWVKSGTGATTKWTGTLNLNTQQAEMVLAGLSSTEVILEVELRQGTEVATKAQLSVTLKTDLINAIDSETDIGNISINTGGGISGSDSRLFDSRRPLPYPVLSEQLFSGVRVEKRVHTRSYNSGEQSWETNIAVTHLPLVLDAYHNSAVVWENGEEGWSLEKSPIVAFGTSGIAGGSSGLIFESDDEGAKIMRLGTIVVSPLPNPAPPAPYTTQATFIESFSATLVKAGGDWDSSAFASKWDSVSPSRNLFNSSTGTTNGGTIRLNDQSETIKDWQLETAGQAGSSYDSFNVAMASTNILFRCSKRYTSWTNGVSPSVEGNGNIIVEIIFYGTLDSLTLGTKINLGVTGGSFTSDGYGGNILTSGYGGSIFTNGYGGTLDLSEHGGSITTGPYGGTINTTGQGSIELGSITQGNPSGTAYGRTILKGSVSGASPAYITLPNETGTIALAPRIAYGGIISASALDAFSGVGTYAMIQGSGVGGSIQVAANGAITIASAGTGYVDGQAIRAGGSRYILVTQANQPASANLPIITKAGGGITTGTFGTTANSFCQGNDARLSDARPPRLTKLIDRDNIGSSTFLPITITGIAKSAGATSNVVITTASPHNYNVNDIVYINGLQTATAGTTGLTNFSTLNGNYVVTAVTNFPTHTFTYFPNSNTALSTLYGAYPKLVERVITKGVIGDMEVGNDSHTSSDCLFVCMNTFSAIVTSGTPLPVGVTSFPTWKKVALVNLR